MRPLQFSQEQHPQEALSTQHGQHGEHYGTIRWSIGYLNPFGVIGGAIEKLSRPKRWAGVERKPVYASGQHLMQEVTPQRWLEQAEGQSLADHGVMYPATVAPQIRLMCSAYALGTSEPFLEMRKRRHQHLQTHSLRFTQEVGRVPRTYLSSQTLGSDHSR